MKVIKFLVNALTGHSALFDGDQLLAQGKALDPVYVLRALGFEDSAIEQGATDEEWFGPRPEAPASDFVTSVIAKATIPLTEEEILSRMASMKLGAKALAKDNALLQQVAPEFAVAASAAPSDHAIGIRLPRVGEQVYVQGFNSIFRAVEGGLATVKLIVGQRQEETYDELNARAMAEPDLNVFRTYDEDDEDHEDEDDEDIYYSGNYSNGDQDVSHLGVTDMTDIFIVFEESPLDMINWKDVKYRQDQLREDYGDQRMFVEFDKENPETLVTAEQLRPLGKAL